MKIEISRYIEDILALADRKNDLDQILFDLNSIADHIGYKSVVDTGDDPEKRKQVVENELEDIGSAELAEYFSNLLKKNEIALFEPGRFKNFVEEFESEIKKIVYFKMTTSIELKPKDLKEITDKLSKKVGRKVMIDQTIDKTIIGGAIIQKDNYILDFSVKSKLHDLGVEWKKSILKASKEITKNTDGKSDR